MNILMRLSERISNLFCICRELFHCESIPVQCTYFQFKQKHSDYKRCNKIALHHITFVFVFENQQAYFSWFVFFSSVLLSIIVCLMFELAHCIDLTFVNAIEHFLFCHSIGNRFAEYQVGYIMARCKCDGIISRNLN